MPRRQKAPRPSHSTRWNPTDIHTRIQVDLSHWGDDGQGISWHAAAWEDIGFGETPEDAPCNLSFRTTQASWMGEWNNSIFVFFDYSGEGSTTYQRVVDAVEKGKLEIDALGLVYFDSLRTKPEARGKGLGTQLTLRVLDFIAEHRIASHGFLTAAPPDIEDKPASPGSRLPRFYAKLGWKRVGRSTSMMYDFEATPRRRITGR